MRFYEFATTLKHIKPLSPPEARIYALKQQKERAGKLLKAEKDRQKKANAAEKIKQAKQVFAKSNKSF